MSDWFRHFSCADSVATPSNSRRTFDESRPSPPASSSQHGAFARRDLQQCSRSQRLIPLNLDSHQSCPPNFRPGFALLTNTIPSFPLSGSDTIMQALGYECRAVTGADCWEMPRPHQATARVLAAFGWQASPDTPVLAAPDGSDSGVLHCALCLRTCGSWNYAPPQPLTSTSSKSTSQRKFLQL